MELNSRFKGLIWAGSKMEPSSIIIGGQGGIGSWLTLLLSRVSSTKTNIFCYDFDKIEEHNIGGQLFGKNDIGAYKANAINSLIYNYGVSKVNTIVQKFKKGSIAAPVMFSGFDNMEARKIMLNEWENYKTNESKLFIDGRLSAENYEVYFVTPENIDRYKATLFDDNEVEDAPCSMKQTSHYAASIASDMIKGYTNWISNLNGDVREVPFKIHEVGEFFLKTIEL